ncbi:uncharacterized protein [Onthophagus taurus]|uniref:uncharacterized protein n=1 Tax=Onthophagus taurus TaxID=166361 RepID=UPI0039BDAB12
MEFKPPKTLDFSNNPAETWVIWKQKFNLYMKASQKDNLEDESVKIAILLNVIGDEGLRIYNTFKRDKDETLEKTMKQFEEYLIPKRNLVVETFKFNNLQQKEEQTIDAYITELRTQAALCEFKCENDKCRQTYEDRMIRDKLVTSIFDKNVQQRLLGESDISLEKIQGYWIPVHVSY